MKRTSALILCLIMLFLTGCSNGENSGEEKRTMNFSEKVKTINVCDFVDNMYSEELHITLSKEEIKSFTEIIDKSSKTSDMISGSPLYSLKLFDSADCLCGSFVVDTRHWIYDVEGLKYKTDKSAETILKQIEENHSISTKIWDRKPGKNYFDILELANNALFYEITDNNFIEGIKYEIKNEECSKLNQVLSTSAFSNEKDDGIKKKYVLELYTSGGGIIVTLFFDNELNAYLDQGYAIDNANLIDEIQLYISKCK